MPVARFFCARREISVMFCSLFTLYTTLGTHVRRYWVTKIWRSAQDGTEGGIQHGDTNQITKPNQQTRRQLDRFFFSVVSISSHTHTQTHTGLSINIQTLDYVSTIFPNIPLCFPSLARSAQKHVCLSYFLPPLMRMLGPCQHRVCVCAKQSKEKHAANRRIMSAIESAVSSDPTTTTMR